MADLLGLANLLQFVQSWWAVVLGYGLVGITIAGFIAAGLLLPFGTRVRIACWIAAALVLENAIVFGWGAKIGADRVQAQWDWTIEVEHVEGEKIRTDAERLVVDEPPDSRVLTHDPWNRDSRPSGSKP
jgi:hypothetical protein